MRELSNAEFLKDVKDHRMKILLDSDLHRHIRFSKPRTNILWFELITWPGYLTIAGDMGTWTFSRLKDMFEFFRAPSGSINPDYWAEKLAHGTFGGRQGAKVFDREIFEERLMGQLEDHYGFAGKELSKVTEAVRTQIFSEDNRHDLISAVRDFAFLRIRGATFQFDLMDVPDGMVYSYHFIWCLYAIVWGINKWDAGDREAAA